MTSNLDTQFFLDNGFLVLDNLLENVDDAAALLENTIKSVKMPTSKDDAIEWISAKSKIQSNKILMDLIKNPQVTIVLNNLLGEFIEPKSCQIASRFPGENYSFENKEWYTEWHIDNYTDKDFERKRIPQDFSCLVGVYLTENEYEFAGNFTVFPGSHYQIQSHSIMNGGRKYYEENGLKKIRKELVLEKPYQIMAKKGSVIFAHRYLAHLISAPNESDDIRTIVWFRVRGNNNCELSFTNIWNDYKGIAKDTKYPEKYNDEIIRIENKGYGYFCSNTKNGIILRIKSNGKKYFPCMFASHVTLTYYYDDNVNIHTNGFINKKNHNLIAKELQYKTLFEMAEWIYKCDYCKLIESWHPSQNPLSQNATNSNDKISQKIIRLHHLHSKSKCDMLIKWGNELKLNGGVLKGVPGQIIATGPSSMINIFVERFKCFHWKQFKEITGTCDNIVVGFTLLDSVTYIHISKRL